MNGFIVVVINKKNIANIADTENAEFESFPVIAEDKKSVLADFKKNHKDLVVLSIHSMKKIKKDIKLMEDLAKQKNIKIV